ncbi:hypothetical protein [Streptomyces sp. NPDC006658]|uniref:hypothetical protein n=1 Tax=Streptomyces sp. NPDC006658 TaxID=3156900 RepID=UPI0033FE9842
MSAHALIRQGGAVLVSLRERQPAPPVFPVALGRTVETVLQECLTALLGHTPAAASGLLRVVEHEWQADGITRHELHLVYGLSLPDRPGKLPAPPGHRWLPPAEHPRLVLPGGPPEFRQPPPTWHFAAQPAGTDRRTSTTPPL